MLDRTLFRPALDSNTPDVRDERRAALFVHALTQEDQAWLLGTLPSGDRQRISEMLEELRQLGIEPDPQIVESALLMDESDDEVDVVKILWRLEGRKADALAALLRAEPTVMVVQVLRIADWPWTSFMLESLDPERRRQIVHELAVQSEMPLPIGVRLSLLRALHQWEKAFSQKPPAFQSIQRSLWQVIVGKVRGFLNREFVQSQS